jgi:RNA polymerase sigma factor (sigma-70 family)
MNARPRPDSRDDAQLVRAARTGDRGAFAAIYDRYADRLHDFCWGLLRDRDEAADATQDAFVVAAERLGQLRDPERLRPWLYAVARSQALRRLRARSRVAPEEEMTDLPDPAPGPEQSAERADLSQLVWEAAGGLSPRDRALLDLHLRHGLEGAELGQAMNIEPGHAYVLLSRLRDQVERSLGAFLVARLGRDDCAELSSILSDWDGRFSPLIRKRVARHVDTCEVCGPARRRLASPVALLAAVPPVPAPALLRRRVMQRIDLTAGARGDAEPGDGGSADAGAGSEAGPGNAGSGEAGSGDAGTGSGDGGAGLGPGSPGAGDPDVGDPGVGQPDARDAGTPGQGSPQSPGSGAPEREGSPPAEEAPAGIHNPLTGVGVGPPPGGVGVGPPPGGAGVGRPGVAAPGHAGRRRRRGTRVGLAAALLLAVGLGVGLGWERAPAGSSPDGQGEPIVAGAVTSVAPSTVPTTSSTSSSTSTSTSTTDTTVPAAPASLAASPARIDLGARTATATLTVRNDGEEPLSWAADPSTDWLRVRPATGRLDGGDQVRLRLSAARDGLPEGDADAQVEFSWGGPVRSVAVALRAEHLPDISDVSATPGQIFAAPCADDTTALVEASVTDESPLSSVALRWGDREVPMTQRSGSWFARLGPVASPALVPWQVVATDARGNTAMAPGLPVRVLACP